MRIGPALGVLRLELQAADLDLRGVRPQVLNVEPLPRHRCHVIIVEEHRLTGADHDIGQIGAYNGDAISADDFAQRVANRLGQPLRARAGRLGLVMFADQMRQNFRVRRGNKHMPLGGKGAFEAVAVLDDAVMDDGDFPGLVQVRMRVFVGGRAVRGPARMADAERTRDRLGAQQRDQAFV